MDLTAAKNKIIEQQDIINKLEKEVERLNKLLNKQPKKELTDKEKDDKMKKMADAKLKRKLEKEEVETLRTLNIELQKKLVASQK